MMFVFRCDASVTIGTGHFKRCLVLARRLACAGHQVEFISAPLPPSLRAEARRSFVVHELSRAGLAAVDDADECKTLIANRPCIVVADHYGLDYRWEQRFADTHHVAVIDDLANRKHFCKVLIDANYRTDDRDPYEKLAPATARRFLGPQHCLVDELVLTKARKRAAAQDRVFVFFGGTDPSNQTLRFLQTVGSAKSALHFDVVITHAHPQVDALRSRHWAEAVRLHVQPANVYELLAQASLFLGSGGTITWERMYLGVPGIVLGVATNQQRSSAALARDGYQVYLGPAENVDMQDAITRCEQLMADSDWRARTAEMGRTLVHAIKIPELLQALQIPDWFREATATDSRRLFEWRNDALTRANSVVTSPIPPETHTSWFHSTLADSQRRLLIYEEHGNPVGHVRFDQKSEREWELSWAVAPAARGRGVGGRMVRAATNVMPSATLHARIKPGNAVSAKIAKTAGFILTGAQDGLALWTLARPRSSASSSHP